ncbi:hypothetical protein CO058_02830 [candidate division WWE3 bacterium CG_4_9_14_0_2_um_filter_35_11]|uniref:SpoVT-AbrB domain-containing protein n=1 Tax=candidate division WWE3 bacterium CG_4_9_14_0_2_um_filter_35_11 TaxID=1975077 RepID=A0A2M8ELB4_UNCKA|nr:MAG: hypothetical protein COV25_01760 [candidate division WWE3 bacterium CG10_big_fil_rev_8_21_14_0_10_35_32]PJC23518.1 MAG: hypothetical protein CO058_02830 [candidate division WWE3 bacterium CG_4_9_14_0_2_um_filter_35_11]
MEYSAKVTTKGQVTIPASLRKKFKMDLQNITFIVKDDELILRPSRDILSLSGIYKSKSFKDKMSSEVDKLENLSIETGFIEKFDSTKRE